MDNGFALLLLVALLLGGALSYLQHRAYAAATRRMTAEYQGRDDMILVSGRGKGWTRGAVVLLVIDSITKRIVAAEAMVGVTIFARFRVRKELVGPLASAPKRAGEKRLAEAVESAIKQYKVVLAQRAVTPRPQAR